MGTGRKPPLAVDLSITQPIDLGFLLARCKFFVPCLGLRQALCFVSTSNTLASNRHGHGFLGELGGLYFGDLLGGGVFSVVRGFLGRCLGLTLLERGHLPEFG